MAGIPAGRLSIEIVAEIARLQKDLDSAKRLVSAASGDIGRNARAANDNLAGIGKGAGAGVQQFGRDIAALKAQLDPAWAAQQRFNEQQRLGLQAFKAGAIDRLQFIAHMRQINGQLKGVSTPMQSVGDGMRQASGNARQFTLQMSQVGQQVMAGTGVIQALAMQLPDIAAGMNGGAASAGRFAAFLGGPWGIALTSAIGLVATFAASHFAASSASEKAAKEADALTKSIDTLNEAVKRETSSQRQNTEARLADAFAMRLSTEEKLKNARAEITRQQAFLAGANSQQSNAMSSQQYLEAESRRNGALNALSQQIAEIDKLQKEINKTDASVRGLQATVVNQVGEQYFNAGGKALQNFDNRLGELTASFVSGKISLQQYASESAKLRGTLQAEQKAIEAASGSQRTRAAGISAAQKEYNTAFNSAQQFISSLQDEIAAIGKAEKEVRALGIAKAVEAAATDAQREAIKKLADERERLLQIEEMAKAAKVVEDRNKGIGEDLGKLRDELKLIGLFGAERERLAITLELENNVRAVGLQLTEAEKAGNTELITQLQAQIILLHKKYDLQSQGIDLKDQFDKDAEAARLLNDQLRDTIDILSSMGKLGQGLGALLGIVSGNTAGLRGPLGDLLNYRTGGTLTDKHGNQIAETIGTKLTKVFDKDGPFGKTMTSLLGGAAIGMTAGGLMGQQSGTQKAGSAFGGALGGEFGKKFLSKGMESIAKGFGQFAGPLGGVIGGVVGNVLGGMFTKAKWGRVELTSGGASGATGNSGTSQKAALAAGNSFTDALKDLASSLGGSVGDFGSIALGVRGGDYRVNTGGTSLKTKKGAMDFGEDADAAVAYAMKQAIERGAINGVRASTNNLLKAGSDLQAQLNKALQFEGVFTDLKAATDPIGAELASVEKQFAGLRTVFAEAGASAAEYAQLEQLLSIKRQEALRKETDAIEDVRARIADARGDEATAKAIERARELRDAISDNVRAELHRLYAIEDATAAQQAATAAAQTYEQVQQEILGKANRRNSLQTRVLELLGRSQDSLASSRLAELAATEKALQPLQAMVYQLEDLTGIVDKFGPLANDLRAFRKELDGLAIDKSFAALAASFRSTAAAAKMGDVTALTNLRGVSQDYLTAAKDNAATLADYQRALGEVMGAVDQGIFAADAQIDYAKAQVEALNRIYDQQADNAATNRILLEAIVDRTSSTARILNRFEVNGMPTVPVE